jgi:hypothetical protein
MGAKTAKGIKQIVVAIITPETPNPIFLAKKIDSGILIMPAAIKQYNWILTFAVPLSTTLNGLQIILTAKYKDV